MPTRRILLIVILLLAGIVWPAPRTRAVKPDPADRRAGPTAGMDAPLPLDQEMVIKYYSEGDFDPAIAKLEEFQRTHSRFTRAESVMVYKYLGVMYSADPQTREKGKSYFYKLLKVDPEAKILDMYVSIVVQEIFRSTLEELMGGMPIQRESPKEMKAAGPAGKTRPDGSRPPGGARVSEKRGHAALWWMGIGALATAGGGYYIYTRNGAKPRDEEIVATP